MNEREFFTQALLSSHSVLMGELMPVALPDDDEELDAEVAPIAEKTALIAALYANKLVFGTNLKTSSKGIAEKGALTHQVFFF